MVGIPHKMLLGKIKFSFEDDDQLDIAFGLVMEAHVHFHSHCWDPIWLRPVLALHDSVSVEFMCVGPACLQSLVSFVSFMPSGCFSEGFSES